MRNSIVWNNLFNNHYKSRYKNDKDRVKLMEEMFHDLADSPNMLTDELIDLYVKFKEFEDDTKYDNHTKLEVFTSFVVNAAHNKDKSIDDIVDLAAYIAATASDLLIYLNDKIYSEEFLALINEMKEVDMNTDNLQKLVLIAVGASKDNDDVVMRIYQALIMRTNLELFNKFNEHELAISAALVSECHYFSIKNNMSEKNTVKVTDENRQLLAKLFLKQRFA